MTKPKILVVDDEINNQRVLTYTLNKAGYESVAVMDGATALEFLGKETPDLAILDVSMPIMDGIELLGRIRALPQYQRLPIIILTGSGDDDERIRAEKIGIQGFLTKPSSSKTILDLVGKLLATHAKH